MCQVQYLNPFIWYQNVCEITNQNWCFIWIKVYHICEESLTDLKIFYMYTYTAQCYLPIVVVLKNYSVII